MQSGRRPPPPLPLRTWPPALGVVGAVAGGDTPAPSPPPSEDGAPAPPGAEDSTFSATRGGAGPCTRLRGISLRSSAHRSVVRRRYTVVPSREIQKKKRERKKKCCVGFFFDRNHNHCENESLKKMSSLCVFPSNSCSVLPNQSSKHITCAFFQRCFFLETPSFSLSFFFPPPSFSMSIGRCLCSPLFSEKEMQ